MELNMLCELSQNLAELWKAKVLNSSKVCKITTQPYATIRARLFTLDLSKIDSSRPGFISFASLKEIYTNLKAVHIFLNKLSKFIDQTEKERLATEFLSGKWEERSNCEQLKNQPKAEEAN